MIKRGIRKMSVEANDVENAPGQTDGPSQTDGLMDSPHVKQPHYFMDSPDEGERLERKTDPVAVGRHLLMTGLRHGMKAADVACGTGAVTRLMAKIAGPGLVTGFDMSEERLGRARELAQSLNLGITFTQAPAHHLPPADGTFDYTHSRMLFQYLPNPQEVLAEMVRVTRPGGSVVVVDLDGQIEQLEPMHDLLRHDVTDAIRTLSAGGFDPRVGRKLQRWFVGAGLVDVTTRAETYQVYSGGQLSEADLSNWTVKLRTAASHLARVTGDTRRWDRFAHSYLEALQAKDAFYYATVVIAQGRAPDSTGSQGD